MIHKTYVINLARCTDKKAIIENNIAKLNLNHEFFSAIDGGDTETTSKFNFKINGWSDPNSGKAMTNGEVGCALSHWSIWSEIVDKCGSGIYPSNGKFLILEDDVVVPDNFLNRFADLTKNMETYDLLYCHRKPLALEHETEYSFGIHRISGAKSYWTCAYVLTLSGATKLVNSLYLQNLIPVDEFLPLMYNCKIYGFEVAHESCEKLDAYAFHPSLIRLCDDAFENSTTFHSDAYEIPNDKLGFVQNVFTGIHRDVPSVQVVLCVISTARTESRQRLESYSKIYGYRLEIFASEAEMKTFLQSLSTRTLVVCICTKSNVNFPAILPVASPKELFDKYTKITNGKLLIKAIVNVDASYDIVCGYAENFTVGTNTIGTCVKKAIYDNKRLIFCSTSSRDDIKIYESRQRFRYNPTEEFPCFAHGSNVNETLVVNRIANYSGNGWNYYYGFRFNAYDHDFPKIFLAVHYGGYNEIFKLIDNLDYPKDKIELHVGVMSSTTEYDYHSQYNPISYSVHETYSDLYGSMANKFIKSDCAYFWMIGEHAVLNHKDVLVDLLSVNKGIIAPMIKDPESYGTNFWSDISENKSYVRGFDYIEQIENPKSTPVKPYVKMGCWDVPYISHTVLIKREVLIQYPNLYDSHENAIVYKEFSYKAREADLHMYMLNLKTYGYLIDPEKVPLLPPNISADTITIADVEKYPRLWEEKYLHPAFLRAHRARTSEHVKELHADIYQYPFFTNAFCREMIELAETKNAWSKGKGENKDIRFGTNYIENVPTQDVQLFQLGANGSDYDKEAGLKRQWNHIIMTYMAPLVKRIYSNYKTKGVHMAFIVRYHQDHQNALEPHHDASTYTMNIALNESGVEYEGGGCRFIRQNLTVKDQPVGYSTIHAGRLTAYHEGLPVTKGVRYILVSFVDN
jgi:GR25 family glycosyltransferase involved in LPS biosynthesis